MRILARYLTALFLRNFLVSAFTLTVVFLFQAIIGMLLDAQFPTRQVLIYQLFSIPQIFVQMSPPAVLMGTVITLSGMGRNQELVACYSIGVGLRQIMSVILSIAFMICCFSLVLQDRIIPPMYRKQTIFYWRDMKHRTDFFLDVKQDKIWYRSNQLIYNLKAFDKKNQNIVGMSVYRFDDNFNLEQVIDAKSAEYGEKGWILKDGTVTLFSSDEDSFPVSKTFKELSLTINETPRDFQEIEREVDGLRLKELLAYIDRTRKAGTDTKSYEVRFHSKISLAFIPMVMGLLAIPFSIRNRREGGLALDLGICLGVTFIYWIFYSVGLSLGTSGFFPPWLGAWLPSACFALMAGGLLVYKRV